MPFYVFCIATGGTGFGIMPASRRFGEGIRSSNQRPGASFFLSCYPDRFPAGDKSIPPPVVGVMRATPDIIDLAHSISRCSGRGLRCFLQPLSPQRLNASGILFADDVYHLAQVCNAVLDPSDFASDFPEIGDPGRPGNSYIQNLGALLALGLFSPEDGL